MGNRWSLKIQLLALLTRSEMKFGFLLFGTICQKPLRPIKSYFISSSVRRAPSSHPRARDRAHQAFGLNDGLDLGSSWVTPS